MKHPERVCSVLALLLVASECWLKGQAGCQPPPLPPSTPAANIFSDPQEVDLGDAIAEQIQHNFRLTSDPELTAYLERVGDRLLKYLPPNHLKFRYVLVDLGQANAFGLAGGRVYLSTKIIATARNEDEVAGVLAHEFGHLVTHQTAIEVTRELKEVLGVTAVTDRRDVFEKYHRLIENRRRKAEALSPSRKHSLQQQEAADRVALYALTSAGYSPDAFAEIFDRTTGTEGKAGSWLSDLFGATSSESRRLREMIKATATLPAGCVERPAARSSEEFKKWQAAVVSYSGWEHQEALHDVVAKVKLQPPLQGLIRNLKFSPDGKYVLAQDAGTIFVLSRQPLRTLFCIEAPDAAPAEFSPDSKSVVFNNHHLRVETWAIAGAKRTGAYELAVPVGCLQTALAPDGKTLACLGGNQDLLLMEVSTGKEMFRARSFLQVGPFVFSPVVLNLILGEFQGPLDVEFAGMGFAPDGRTFLAASAGNVVAYDLVSRETVSLPGALKKRLREAFAFIGPDRLIAKSADARDRSPILRFPSGEKLGEVQLGIGRPVSVTHGDYVLIRPVRDYGVGIFDLKASKGVMANKKPALDVYDDVIVREERDGEVALFNWRDGQQIARTELPGGLLGKLKAVALSPDLGWLAASETERGGVWNLHNGNRLYMVRPFQGAYFAEDGNLYADFPKREQTDRMIARVNLTRREVTQQVKISEEHVHEHAQFLVVTKPEKPDLGVPTPFGVIGGGLNENVTREIRDTRTGQTLWSRHFPKEAPSLYVAPQEGTMILAWSAAAKAVQEEARDNPQVRERLKGAKLNREDYFLEIVKARSGAMLGSILVDTGKGSFYLVDAFAAGDWVIVTDSQNRTLLYSLSSGEEKGRFFGTLPTIEPRAGLMAVENERGNLNLYDLSTLESLDQFVFPSPIMFKTFAADGKRLLVLTADQTVYTLDVSATQH